MITLCTDGVQDMSVGAISPHIIGIAWKPPTNHTDDGAFWGYTMNCTSGHTFNLPGTSKVTLVTDLQPFTNYTCCITPHWWTNGDGPEACVSTTTQQDGELTGVASMCIETCRSSTCYMYL